MNAEHPAQVLSEAMVHAAKDMAEAEARIMAARKRLAEANRKYNAYQKGQRK